MVWASLMALPTLVGSASALVLTIDPNHVEGTVDERIYSQFLEHIYHSVEGGLWGELIWNRSFEENSRIGLFPAQNKVELNDQVPNHTFLMGENLWKDYDFTVEARKTAGTEGFLVLFRCQDRHDTYQLNLGDTKNTLYALQKCTSGQPPQILARVPGSIATDQWYRIRIRCQGDHLFCWINDQLIFDHIDSHNPYVSGKVGLRISRRNRAEFRHFKVIDLQGKTLLDHLTPSLPRYWESTGSGTVSLDTHNPLNSDLCLCLTGDNAGVQQGPIHIIAHETYTGSVWARGISSGGLLVRLIQGATLLAEQTLPLASDQWTEIPFTFQPQSSTAEATFQIKLAHGGTAWIDQVSMLSKSARQTDGFNPNLLRLLAELRPPLLRWPGGDFVTHYRWKDGIGPQSQRRVYPDFIWDDRDTNAFGLDEFMRLCHQIQCQPIIVVNCHPPRDASESTVKAYLQDTLDLMEYCNGASQSPWGSRRARNGHESPYHVTYWELDDLVTTHLLDIAQQWVRAMKTAYPGIKLMVDAYYGTTPDIRKKNMQTLQDLGPDIDFVSIEQYDAPQDYRTAPAQWNRYFTQMQELIARSPNPQIKMYVSEWNLTCDDWRAGLYTAGLLNTFERHSDLVKISSPAILMCYASAGDNRVLIRFDQSQWVASPTYVVMKLWHDFYAPTRLSVTGDTDRLNAIATQTKDRQWMYLKLVNPTPDGVDLTLKLASHFSQYQVQMWTINAQLNQVNSFGQPHNIAPVFQPLLVSQPPLHIHVPPYSADVICLQRSPEKQEGHRVSALRPVPSLQTRGALGQ